MKKNKLIAILSVVAVLLLAVFVWKGVDANASAPTQKNVSVTVPSNLDVVFLDDGSTSVDDVKVLNESIVPITLVGIELYEYNDWEVVPSNSKIELDTKKLAFQFEGQDLVLGSNHMQHEILEGCNRDFHVNVTRGPWSETTEPEKALELEFVYILGRKEFNLTLNDGVGDSETIVAENDDNVLLPPREREDYEFVGWQDEDGKLYKDLYVMPVGNTTLNAVWNKKEAYALYSETDKTLTFVKSAQEIKAGDVYDGINVTAVYSGFENVAYKNASEVPWYTNRVKQPIHKVIVRDVIKPISTAYWFSYQVTYYFDLTNLNMSNVTDAKYMFYYTRPSLAMAQDFVIVGMDDWDMSKVTDVKYMFEATGNFSKKYSLGDISGWDMSNVTTMLRMFNSVATRATVVEIGDLSNWDTSKVTNMAYMFSSFAGEVSKISLGNLGKWNTSNVTSMSNMFNDFAMNSSEMYIGDLSTWNTSKVIDMSGMFSSTGYCASNFNIGNIGKWDVSNVTDMTSMFYSTAALSKTFYIGDLSSWNTANVTSMYSMFHETAPNASWSLNLSKWNVNNVLRYWEFSYGIEKKITQPKWVHQEPNYAV